MDFQYAAKLSAHLSKEYAQDFFELLINYHDISASEAASRLGLHIRTAQDFLDGLASLDILHKEEVYEKKRPYFRYSLKTQRIVLDIDLTQIRKRQTEECSTLRIREKANSGVNFSLGRDGETISHVSLWTGEGRDRKERRIGLTLPQGKFLYHLPFPNAEHSNISEIMRKAEVDTTLLPEILDLVELLEKHAVIEVAGSTG